MKKLISILLILIMIATLASCADNRATESPSGTNASDNAINYETLAGKTPKEIYNFFYEQFLSATNFEAVVIEKEIQSYNEETLSEKSYETTYKTNGEATQYSVADLDIIYVDGVLYSDMGGSKEKYNYSKESFAEGYTLNKQALFLPLGDSYFEDLKFVLEDGIYYLKIMVSVEDFAQYVSFNASMDVQYNVAFDASGKLLSISSIARYISSGDFVVTMDRVVALNIGTVQAIAAPADADEYRLPPVLSDIDMTPLANLDGVAASDNKTDYVRLNIEGYDTPIIIRLYSNVAPETVENFKNLVDSDFYNGLVFHRVIKDFMIQGGCINAQGEVKTANNIAGEFTSNGFTNNLLHTRGVVSMARAGDADSANSQFFIVHKDYPSLNGKYAAFGYVVWGMEVVDAITEIATDDNAQPTTNIVISSAEFVTVA